MSKMFWRDPSIVKGTSSIWSMMFSVLAILAIVWIIAFNIQDPTWRWSIAGIGTIVALGSPGGLSCIYWRMAREQVKEALVARQQRLKPLQHVSNELRCLSPKKLVASLGVPSTLKPPVVSVGIALRLRIAMSPSQFFTRCVVLPPGPF